MKTDTIIGIVGSIVLIGVMVGVFIYEYNNVEAQNEEELQRQLFANGANAHLDPDQDLDGDGIPNFQDDDLDGDGTKNSMDESLQILVPFSGSFAAASGELASHSTNALQGVSSVTVTTAINPTLQLVEAYTVEVTQDGTLVESGSSPITINASPGSIGVSINVDILTVGGTYEGSFLLQY